ncbi:MAG: hypothetical protein ABSC94_11685 [Polyangiaceae bacterium]|jgi:hypothetical protein
MRDVNRKRVSAALLGWALGCSGKVAARPDGGASSSGDGLSSSGSGTTVQTSTAKSSGPGESGGATTGGSTGESSSGSRQSSSVPLDAGLADAHSATCTGYAFEIELDAAPNTCAFTAADVACNTNADCTTYVKSGCGCADPVYGVNQASTALCIAPPCVAPRTTCDADASGLYTQDCQFVSDLPNVSVACVDHQCLTYAAGAQ